MELIDETYHPTVEADRAIRRWLNRTGWSLSRRYEVAWNAARDLTGGQPDRELVRNVTAMLGEHYDLR